MLPSPFFLFSFRPRMTDSILVRVFTPTCGVALVIATLLCAPARVMAGSPDEPVAQPQRLSAWLEAHAAALADRYPLGAMWLVDAERVSQQQEREALLTQVARLRQSPAYQPGDVDRLLEVIRALPATGRVRTAAVDGRWLEANPARDPMLQPGDRLHVPPRPRSVAVLRSDGRWCHVLHAAAATARTYLDSCRTEGASPDWAWVVQPDGRLHKAGVADWNTTSPLSLAPGAWIWAPPAADHDAEATHEALARWLSLQGASGDPLAAGQILPIRSSDAELQAQRSERSREAGNRPTASDWGFVGLMQTPTARMREPGDFSLSFQRVWPYTNGNVFLQPFEALEVGFRYTDVANVAYGPESLSGDQSYKDKSIDLKLRLWSESRWAPELAVGVLDLGGTGLFGSEYLVASKRWGALDFSLGLAWGYLGRRGDMGNPLGVFSDRFKERPDSGSLTGQGGTVGYSRFFRGPVGLIGGVQWQPADGPVLLKAELDGNDYRNEPHGKAYAQKWPINLGLVYQVHPSVDLNIGYERGNKASLGIAFKVPLSRLSARKTLDPVPVPVVATRPTAAPDWSRTAAEVARQTGWAPEAVTLDAQRLQLDFAGAYSTYARDRLDKALAVMHRDAPASVETLEIRLRSMDEVQMSARTDRSEWVRSMTEPPRTARPADPVRLVQGLQADGPPPADRAAVRTEFDRPRLGVRPTVDLIQTIGGPDGFVLYQVSAAARASLRLPAGWQARGHVRLRLFDNYERFRYDGPSNLPRVRTHLREYLTTSRATLDSLTLSQSARLGADHYYAVYGGYFESMYGGVGGEWLYRPAGSRLAFGVDANRVRQRDFHQDLRFRDYQVNTGHATLYWDTGWNGVKASVSAGRYLAGDRGATVVLQKLFANGVSMAAFATRTNVSAAQFGEGSFDKGIVVGIPFDAFLPRSSALTASFLWRPLTRDGGAMVVRPVNLMGDTVWLDPTALSYRSAPLPDGELPPDDRAD